MIIFILKVILVLATSGLVCAFTILIKNDYTLKNTLIIVHAIGDYQLDCIENDTNMEVDFEDMEDYNDTLLRLWDWGYTRVLPKDKFEIIKPYISEK
jgi:hypothetical protein